MTELPPAGLQLAGDVASIASTPGSIQERAEALLEPLRRLVPFEAAWIALLDPERGEHIPLLANGEAEPLTAYFRTPSANAELELIGMHRARPPMCLRDLPIPPTQLRAWADFLWPAGFREGVAVGLFTGDSRHLGYLCLLTDTPAHPTDAARDLIGKLAPLIATAVDRMPSIAAAAQIVRDAAAGIVLTRAGTALPLPGLPGHPLLTAGSAVLAAAAHHLAGGAGHDRFLAPNAGFGTAGGHVRVTVLDCVSRPPDHLCAVVLLSPPGDLRRLTPLELQVLGMLIDGWPDQRITAALAIPDSAVAGHIEHILTKLDAPTRDLAIIRAAGHGLHVPPAVNEIRE
jgi:DNA-binding CsgD family transcriptional regulator